MPRQIVLFALLIAGAVNVWSRVDTVGPAFVVLCVAAFACLAILFEHFTSRREQENPAVLTGVSIHHSLGPKFQHPDPASHTAYHRATSLARDGAGASGRRAMARPTARMQAESIGAGAGAAKGGDVMANYKGKVGDGFDVKQMPGVMKPTGFFDPWGISSRSKRTEERIRYFREAELKHGRIAMLAALGFVLQESFHPLFGGQIDVPSYKAFQQTPLQAFWGVTVHALMILEAWSVNKFKFPADGMWQLKDDYELGNLGFDPMGIKPAAEMGDGGNYKDLMDKELANGRLAMLGIAGMVAQELVTDKKVGIPLGAGTSRSLDSVLGIAASAEDLPSAEHVQSLAKEVAQMLEQTSDILG